MEKLRKEEGVALNEIVEEEEEGDGSAFERNNFLSGVLFWGDLG